MALTIVNTRLCVSVWSLSEGTRASRWRRASGAREPPSVACHVLGVSESHACHESQTGAQLHAHMPSRNTLRKTALPDYYWSEISLMTPQSKAWVRSEAEVVQHSNVRPGLHLQWTQRVWFTADSAFEISTRFKKKTH